MPKGDLIKYVTFEDTAANDSNKTISFANVGKHDCQLISLHVSLATTATVGDRLLELEFLDADGTSMGHVHPGSYQAASLTYHYYFMQGIFRETVSAVAETGVDGTLQVPIPIGLVIPAGGSIVVKDVETKDAAADDMIIRGQLKVMR